MEELCQRLLREFDSRRAENSSKMLCVEFPVFEGDENEDVREFLDNYKRAGKLNRWSEEELALGLPLYLKGHASIWFRSLRSKDEMTFDKISTALTERFASGANNWRLRLALSQRRQQR